ncbi:MAG: hypothetical protein IT424_08800 [Pirellulales bacterium]|nr:hypothetical protein [Pirellulales bacterium]
MAYSTRLTMVALLATLACGLTGSPTSRGALRAAALTLESATMGPAGQGSGSPLSASQFVGWRFLLTKRTAISQVGGHLGGVSGNLFAAIVSLSGASALPQGAPFTDAEVVATTVFNPSLPTNDFRVALPVVLNAGAYALVFGSGKYNAAGAGLLPNGQQTNVAPTLQASYITWRQILPGRYQWTAGSVNSVRLVVVGSEIAGAADFNFDNQINGADLAIWRANVGGPATGGSASGDADLDGDVDGADFMQWQRTAVAALAPPPVAPVPEPDASALIVAGPLLALRLRRRLR